VTISLLKATWIYYFLGKTQRGEQREKFAKAIPVSSKREFLRGGECPLLKKIFPLSFGGEGD